MNSWPTVGRGGAPTGKTTDRARDQLEHRREPPSGKMIKAVTLDCWGTILLDSPAADEHYRRQRLTAIRRRLHAAHVSVTERELERAYADSARRLARIWHERRDVP